MSVTVTSQKFYDEFTGTGGGGSDYLIGSVGAKITCVTEFYVKWSSENIAVIVAEDSNNNTIRRTDNGSFLKDGFKISDTFTSTGMGADSGNYTISDVNDKVITITGTFSTKTTYLRANLFGTTDINSSDFFFNLVENDAPDSFVSLVDNQTQQKYTIQNISATGSTANYSVATNSKGWVIDQNGFGVSILGMGISNYKQMFKITHVFVITPIALYSQLSNLQNGIPPAPDYMQDRKCLRYLCRMDMKTEKTMPDTPHTLTFSRKGNTAWYDEFLNGSDPTYTVSGLTYTYGGNSVDSARYDDSTATIASFTITSSAGTFTTGTTAVLQMVYIPGDESDYTNTATKFRQAFIYDRCTMVCGTLSGGGIGKSTSGQQFNTGLMTFVNSTTITVAIQLLQNSAGETLISGKDSTNRNYLFFLTIQSPTVTTSKGTDMNSVIIDVNSYDKDLDDSTLVTVNPSVSFKDIHGSTVGDELTGHSGDVFMAVVPFQVKNSSSQLLYSAGIRIDAVPTGGTGTFTLEQWEVDTTDICLDDGVQEINITQPRGLRLPDDHAYNIISLLRDTSLDTATKAGYNLKYPFVIRYETWRQLENADCDFGDATQDWSVISNKSGWNIKLYFTASVYDPTTDHTTVIEQECDITATSSPTGSTGSWGTVTTYDSTSTYDLEGDILFNENTIVVADFYGSYAALPAGATGYAATIYLDQGVIGGATWAYPISSREDLRQADDLSPWLNATGDTGTCSIVQISNTHIQVKARLNYEKLQPSNGSYLLRAKLDYIYS